VHQLFIDIKKVYDLVTREVLYNILNEIGIPMKLEVIKSFMISNFRRVLNVVCLLLGDSSASEFYIPTFRNTLLHLHRQVGACRMN